jgi:hypothetical protein
MPLITEKSCDVSTISARASEAQIPSDMQGNESLAIHVLAFCWRDLMGAMRAGCVQRRMQGFQIP